MRQRLAAIIITSLFLFNAATLSQDESVSNLLDNGDFEGDFVELDGEDPRNVAEGWAPWHLAADDSSPSFAFHNPNYDEETDRIRLDDAGKAQKYFTLFATHEGGVYQEVDSLTSGTTYRFSIYAYVWSSSFEDIDKSEDPGDVVVRVGIDPNGGVDGASEDIVWSTAATFFYDAYRQYAVIATAKSETITVFVESTVGEPRANNYVYLDDAVLEVASETSSEATPTSEANDGLTQATATEEPTATATETQDGSQLDPRQEDSNESEEPPNPTATATSEANDGLTQATATEEPTATATETLDGSQLDPSEPNSDLEEETSEPTVTSAPTLTATPTATPRDTEAPTETPTPAATATVTSTAGIEADGEEFAETISHVVADGDTVSGLAVQYGSTIEAINLANDLDASNVIIVGQRLTIPINLPDAPVPGGATAATATDRPTATATPTITPSPTATPITYQIRPGDTLQRIAQQHGSTVEEIAAQNNIVNVHQIDVGVILVIPTAIPPSPTLTPIPTATAITLATTAPTSAPGGEIIYVVQAGDLLSEIAAAYGATVDAIVQLNGITNPSRIFPGQELRIPADASQASGDPNVTAPPTATPTPWLTPTPVPTAIPALYTVGAGETLYSIAEALGISVVELAAVNNITNYNDLSVGQVLVIPG